MLHPMVKKTIPWALSAAMLVTTVPPHLVQAATTTATTPATPVYTTPAIGKVSLGGASYIEIKGVQQLGRTVRFTVSLYNGGATELQFIDYWVRLRSAGGSQFSPTLFEADKDKNRVAPKTTETFSFYASVSDTTKLSDLTFDIIKWDFSVSSFQRTLGSLKIPAMYQPVTPAGSLLSTSINGVPAKAQVKRSSISKTSDKYIASIVFEFENAGSKSFAIPAYEYAIVTADGLTYPLTVSGLPQNASLHPRFKEEITLRGELPASLENKNWKLVLSEKQGDTMTVPSMSFFLPASTAGEVSDSVAIGSAKDLLVTDQKIEAKVTRTVRNENDKNFLAAIRFSFKNTGTKPVTLPKYTFQIETSAGLRYPVTADLNNVSVDPLVEREIEMRATVPNSVGKDGWKLILNEPADASDPASDVSQLAKFDLPNDNPIGLDQGSAYSYSNEAGTYSIQFENVQRVPWEDEDILSASFEIKNPGKTSLPVPEIVGYFMLDDKIKVEATMLQKDTVLAIKPGGSINLQLYGKIPYTYEYSDLKVYLQEKTGTGEGDVANIVDFTAKGTSNKLPVVKIGQKHKIEGVGRATEISVRDVRSYEGTDSNLFTTLIDMKNLEKRFNDLTKLYGYYTTADGNVYPAEISNTTSKVLPSGVASVLISAPMSKAVDLTKLELVLGEAVTGGKFTSNGEADSFVNAVAYQLPSEPKEPKTEFDQLTFFPYTLSMTDVRAKLASAESILFSFNYTLSKNTFVTTDNDEREIILEFEDKQGSVAFTKTITLGSGEASSSKLIVGAKKNYELEIEDKYILMKLQYLNGFTVKIYDQYQGQSKLIAQKEVPWF